ncbi:MAG: o-succinylbenzoate synthase [Anaerolineae bacterium]|nr:o-succinylbenzoate synthase [Anaerolineae bacterium]
MTVREVILHPVAMPLVRPFETSFGTQTLRAAVLVELHTLRGAVGWGEVTADWAPGYSYETVHTALHVLSDFLIPRLMAAPRLMLDGRWPWLSSVRGHPLAKHALVSAILSAVAEEQELPFADLLLRLSSTRQRRTAAEVGVSIGVQPTIRHTLEAIEQHLAEGYRRIKLKIKPGWDVIVLRGVRAVYPDITLMADANSAYTLADLPMLKQLDEFNLLMIEQPLAYDDIYHHSLLQKELNTPLCLDESIHSLGDVQLAWELGACGVINLKPQRVGGFFEAVRIHDFCLENSIPLWVGGMLETGVGRAASLALACLPGITLPSDLSATARYYDPDLADPPFVLEASSSTLSLPEGPGLGIAIVPERLQARKAPLSSKCGSNADHEVLHPGRTTRATRTGARFLPLLARLYERRPHRGGALGPDVDVLPATPGGFGQ